MSTLRYVPGGSGKKTTERPGTHRGPASFRPDRASAEGRPPDGLAAVARAPRRLSWAALLRRFSYMAGTALTPVESGSWTNCGSSGDLTTPSMESTRILATRCPARLIACWRMAFSYQQNVRWGWRIARAGESAVSSGMRIESATSFRSAPGGSRTGFGGIPRYPPPPRTRSWRRLGPRR